MPLTGDQISSLADVLNREWGEPDLDSLAVDLDENYANIAGGLVGFKARASRFISELNGRVPPRDREFLEKLRDQGTPALRAAADELLKPTFLSTTQDPHDAILLGKRVFVGREDLRSALRRELTNPSPTSTRVLVVSGVEPGGKSYSYYFLHHLAPIRLGALAMRLRLSGKHYTPRQLFDEIFRLLGLDRSKLPPLTDDPQLARIDALVNEFKGQISNLQNRYWLIIDDLNDPGVIPAIREAAYAVAFAVEEVKPEKLWVALLGYNVVITDDELRYVAKEDAQFPTAAQVATHFEAVSKTSPRSLTEDRAREIADRLFEKFPGPLDKAAMMKLTDLFEATSAKLRLGVHP